MSHRQTRLSSPSLHRCACIHAGQSTSQPISLLHPNVWAIPWHRCIEVRYMHTYIIVLASMYWLGIYMLHICAATSYHGMKSSARGCAARMLRLCKRCARFWSSSVRHLCLRLAAFVFHSLHSMWSIMPFCIGERCVPSVNSRLSEHAVTCMRCGGPLSLPCRLNLEQSSTAAKQHSSTAA